MFVERKPRTFHAPGVEPVQLRNVRNSGGEVYIIKRDCAKVNRRPSSRLHNVVRVVTNNRGRTILFNDQKSVLGDGHAFVDPHDIRVTGSRELAQAPVRMHQI